MKIYYIGPFPPIYGGVTVKNKNLYEIFAERLDVHRIDLSRVKRGELKETLRFVWALLTGKQYVIGISSQKNRCLFTKFLYWLKRKAMSRSVLMIMGGVVDDVTDAGADFVRMLNTYRKIYVELPGMLKELAAAGICNGAIYPNGRPRPDALLVPTVSCEPLNCVFFSIIQPEKGVDIILQAAQMLPQMQFHFYGEIRKDYRQAFLNAIQTTTNAIYHGVFTGQAGAVYRELSRYDVLLLPTRWKEEGLPGILVEAKIAGLPAIVSDHNFNKEIVHHDYDGFVIQEITAEKLASALEMLNRDREKLLSMKLAAKDSAEQYYIDVCASEVIRELERE